MDVSTKWSSWRSKPVKKSLPQIYIFYFIFTYDIISKTYFSPFFKANASTTKKEIITQRKIKLDTRNFFTPRKKIVSLFIKMYPPPPPETFDVFFVTQNIHKYIFHVLSLVFPCCPGPYNSIKLNNYIFLYLIHSQLPGRIFFLEDFNSSFFRLCGHTLFHSSTLKTCINFLSNIS